MSRRISLLLAIVVTWLSVFSVLSAYAESAPEWLVFTRENSDLPDNNVLSLALDENDILWIGTKFEGLASFDGRHWGHFRPPEIPGLPKRAGASGRTGPQAQAFYDLAIDSKGVKWVGTKIAGIKRFDGRTWTWYHTTNSGIPNDYAWNVLIDADDRVWVGTKYAGIGIFDGQSWVVLNTTNSPLPSDDVTCLARDRDGSIWIGTTKGIAVLKNNTWRIYNTQNSGLPVDHVEVIAVDQAGGKWIGTWGGGLAYLDGDTWQVYTPANSGLPDLYIWSLALDRADVKWIGTYTRGLVRFDGTHWRVFNSQNSPLPHDMVYDIVIDRRGNTWAATLLGLAVYKSGGVDLPGQNSPNDAPTGLATIESIVPNPFRQQTAITLTVSRTVYAEVRIYDLLGRPVRRLAAQYLSSGTHTLLWDGVDDEGQVLPSGVYFCSVRTGGERHTRRLVLLR